MILRAYQSAAVAATWEHLRTKPTNPCVVIPTGGGKSPVLAQLCKDVVGWKGRVLVATHVKELIEQNLKHIERLVPDITVGVYSAGLGSRDTEYDVTVGGIQSIYKRADQFGKLNVIIIDEAHRIPADGEGMYRSFLEAAKEINPGVRLIGLTATPYRTTTGALCSPDGLLNEVCFEIGVRELIRDGYLSPFRSKGARSKINTDNVSVRAGEFVPSELQAAVSDEEKVASACLEIGQHTQDCDSVLVFCCGVEHAKLTAKILEDVVTENKIGQVYGDTPPEDRERIIRDFREKRIKYLINVDVLTTGFDAPGVDCVAVLRPTLSPGLWVQMCGRGSRLAPGKKDCLILDFGGNALRHGPIDCVNLADIERREKTGKPAPFKECPECMETCAAGSSVCLCCGFQFPKREVKHTGKAGESDAMSGEEVFEVASVTHSKHFKGGDETAKPTMRVNYDIGTMYGVSEWVCIEHTGYALTKAREWWAKWGAGDFPKSVDEALAIIAEHGCQRPERVAVRMEGKYQRITRYEGSKDVDGVPF